MVYLIAGNERIFGHITIFSEFDQKLSVSTCMVIKKRSQKCFRPLVIMNNARNNAWENLRKLFLNIRKFYNDFFKLCRNNKFLIEKAYRELKVSS